ncbi:hypothetical protein [Terrarubrum flagellatum]|uniref:hypothetical protein n=1 Tax=Terrirubrum flagellatum TaxID=2895980 RepID=UPI0031455360
MLARLFAEHDAIGLIRHQSDYRVDLLLRSLEREFVERRSRGDTSGGVADDLQFLLTRYWLLSTYEAMRIVRDSKHAKSNSKLLALCYDFEAVRVPIAKLEIANDSKLKPGLQFTRMPAREDDQPEPYKPGDYYPPTIISSETGSVGWVIIEPKKLAQRQIFRRDLSDRMLSIFD